MDPLVAGVAALLGTAVGSFVNVVIHRVPRGMSIVRPPSGCPECNASIRARDNVPVLSYVLLRGRCRSCRASISVRYPLVELTVAVIWAGSVLRFGVTERAVFVALAASVLVALAAIDLEHRRLPNSITYPATVIGAIWVGVVAVATADLGVALVAGGSAAAVFAILLLIALVSGGMGMGDVKLGGFIGLVCGRFGWESAFVALLAGFILGGVAALALLALGRKGRKEAIPFGPALAGGALLALFWGDAIARVWLGT